MMEKSRLCHKLTIAELPKHCCPLPVPDNAACHVLTADELPSFWQPLLYRKGVHHIAEKEGTV